MMKKVLCFFALSLCLVSGAFAQNHQRFATHEFVLNGQRLNASVTTTGGEWVIQEICIDRLPCMISVDAPNHATTSMGGETFDIPKGPNVTGQPVYHNMTGQCVKWQLHQNAQRVGYWEVCLENVGRNSIRTYRETFQIPGSFGSSVTHMQGLTILSQRGAINNVPFSVRKF